MFTTRSAPVARRAGALAALSGLGLTVSVLLAGPASAAAPTITRESNTGNCNGVRDTPGSANTTKTLTGGTLAPGGNASFEIDYPIDADAVGKELTITDCVFLGTTAAERYTITFVPNTTHFTFDYTLSIPDDAPIGVEYCNHAKVTDSPSKSPGSNRKTNPACFSIRGALRVEKRAGSVEGALLPGATFTVACTPTVANPPVQIDGLDADGVATTGTIDIAGPEGTPCVVTETAAPDGYVLDSTPRTLTIPRGTAPTTSVFVNSEVTDGGCPDGMVDDGDGGCVTPTEEPSEEPSVEPTETASPEPTVEPGDPTPSISPTVKGVKIVKERPVPTLPHTGAPTEAMLAVGLLLTLGGGVLLVSGGRYQRQH